MRGFNRLDGAARPFLGKRKCRALVCFIKFSHQVGGGFVYEFTAETLLGGFFDIVFNIVLDYENGGIFQLCIYYQRAGKSRYIVEIARSLERNGKPLVSYHRTCAGECRTASAEGNIRNRAGNTVDGFSCIKLIESYPVCHQQYENAAIDFFIFFISRGGFVLGIIFEYVKFRIGIVCADILHYFFSFSLVAEVDMRPAGNIFLFRLNHNFYFYLFCHVFLRVSVLCTI